MYFALLEPIFSVSLERSLDLNQIVGGDVKKNWTASKTHAKKLPVARCDERN